MSLVHTNATMNATVPVKNLFLRTVLANSCAMRPEDVDVEHFFSLPEFLFSACLLVTFANAGPTFIALLVHLKRFFDYALPRFCGKCKRCPCRKVAVAPEKAAPNKLEKPKGENGKGTENEPKDEGAAGATAGVNKGAAGATAGENEGEAGGTH